MHRFIQLMAVFVGRSRRCFSGVLADPRRQLVLPLAPVVLVLGLPRPAAAGGFQCSGDDNARYERVSNSSMGSVCSMPSVKVPLHYVLDDPKCDPTGMTGCTVRAMVRFEFPNVSINSGETPWIFWHSTPTAPDCDPGNGPPPSGACQNVIAACGIFGTPQLTEDFADTWYEIAGVTCDTPLDPAAVLSINAWTCPIANHNRVVQVDNVALSGPAMAAAIGCPVEEPTDPGDCKTDPSGRGTSIGGGETRTNTPPSSSPRGMPLSHRARGPGHPGFPGSAGQSEPVGVDPWSIQLGRYWVHPFAQRIVESPDETNVFLITESGTFHRFINLSGSNEYLDVVPSDDYRTLEFLGAGAGWQLTELDGRVRRYRADGLWGSTTDRNGNATTGCYVPTSESAAGPTCDPAGSPPLQAVEFPDGRRVDLAYAGSGKLATLTEAGVDGTTTRVWSYAWTGDDLARIDRPDSTALELFYNDARYPGFMTRQDLLPAGGGTPRVLAGWQYDGDGNVVATWQGETVAGANGDEPGPGAVDLYTLSFDDPADPATTTVTLPNGGTTIYSFERVDGKPRLSTVSGDCPRCGFGPSARFAYDDVRHPLLATEIEEVDGDVEILAYDDNGRLTSRTEATNEPTLTRETTWAYDASFPDFPTLIRQPSVEPGEFRETAMSYDAVTGDIAWREIRGLERVGGVAQPFSYRTSFLYNPAGQPTSIDPPGFGTDDETLWTYDASRGGLLPSTRTDPLDLGTETFAHDPFNRRVRTLDANGLATDTQYDPLDRVRFTIQRTSSASPPGDPPQAGDLTTENLYNGYGDLAVTILPRGNRIVYGYDAAGRLLSIEGRDAADAPRERTLFTLDATGNRTLEQLQSRNGASWETASETSFEYNAGGCQLEKTIRDPNGAASVTEFAYDCSGNLERVWDANHPSAGQTNPATQIYSYDALDRLTQIDQPWLGAGGGTSSTVYAYDFQDHLVQVTDAEGNATSYEYSDRDLLTDQDSVASGVTRFVYNEHGELAGETDARSVTVTRSVDAADRLTLVDYPAGGDVSYAYGTDPLVFEQGRLVGITRHNETVAYAYDLFGRVVQDGELAYSYDLNSNRETITYPGGVTAAYVHDWADRQAALSVDPGTGGGPQPVVVGGEYLPSGPLARIDLGNGLSETRGYDGRYVPASIAVAPTGGGTTLFSWDYTAPTPPDGVGNVRSITDTLDPANNRAYVYQDVAYYLVQGDGPWGTLAWTYDKIGNRLTESRDGAAVDSYVYESSGGGNTPLLDRVDLGGGGSREYTYGAAGHLERVATGTGGNPVVLTTGAEGRLVRAERPDANEETNLTYDGRSFLSESRPEVLELFFRDGFETGDFACWTGDPSCADLPPVEPALFTRPIYSSEARLEGLHARDDSQAPERRKYVFYLAGRPVSILVADDDGAGNLSNESLTYVATDHLGTPVELTDASGAELWEGGLGPFGEDYSDAGSDVDLFLRLPGQWADITWMGATQGVDLYYNVHRWYEEGTGRYSSVDPIGPSAPEDFDESYFNDYLYAAGNSLVNTDPSGLITLPLGPAVPDRCRRRWQNKILPRLGRIVQKKKCRDHFCEILNTDPLKELQQALPFIAVTGRSGGGFQCDVAAGPVGRRPDLQMSRRGGLPVFEVGRPLFCGRTRDALHTVLHEFGHYVDCFRNGNKFTDERDGCGAEVACFGFSIGNNCKALGFPFRR